MQRQLNGRVRDLRVLLQDQGIILRGQTSTYYVKQLAQHAAMEVSGLPIVANDIEVR
ncbi:MAG: BON domain-containing protein [Gemmataceae bacterium]|nr:BON domain-containing protein [Gemmataceae bacterium]